MRHGKGNIRRKEEDAGEGDDQSVKPYLPICDGRLILIYRRFPRSSEFNMTNFQQVMSRLFIANGGGDSGKVLCILWQLLLGVGNGLSRGAMNVYMMGKVDVVIVCFGVRFPEGKSFQNLALVYSLPTHSYGFK